MNVCDDYAPGSFRDREVGRVSPTAGLSIQITFERFDSPPYGPWVGLGITSAWAIAALIVGAWTLSRRDV